MDAMAKIGGDASGVVDACMQAQAAIDAVHGKTERIHLEVTGGDKAMGEMGRVERATDAATAAHERHASSVRNADTFVQRYRDNLENMRSRMADVGNESDRTGTSVRGLGDSTDRATRSMGGVGDGSARASAGLKDVGRETEKTDQASQGLFSTLKQDFWHGAGTELQKIAAAHEAAGTDFETTGIKASLGAKFMAGMTGAIGDAGTEAEKTVGAVGGLAGMLGKVDSAASGFDPGKVAGPLTTVGTAALYATAGAGVLTGAVGALGAVGVGALGGMGLELGKSGEALTKFTIDALKDTPRFKAAFAEIGKEAKGFEAQAVQPYGDALVKMAHEGLKAAPGLVTPVKAAFTEIGAVAEGGTKDLIKSAGLLADGFKEVTHDAAPAFETFFKSLPGLTGDVIDPVDQLVKKFSSLSGAATAGVPAFGRMLSAAGGMGSELLQIGADNLTPFSDDVTSMLSHVTGMAHGLEPAIKPAMGAVTSLVNTVADALGDPKVAAGIQTFSDTVTKSAPQIQHALTGITQAALGVGSATVATVGGIADFGAHAVGGDVPLTSPVLSPSAPIGKGGQLWLGADGKVYDTKSAAAAAPTAAQAEAHALGATGAVPGVGPAATHDRTAEGPHPQAPGAGVGPSAGQDPGSHAPANLSTVTTGPTDDQRRFLGGGLATAPASARSQLAVEAGVDPSLIHPAGGGGAGAHAPQFTGGGGGPADAGASLGQLQNLGPAAQQAMGQVQSAAQQGAQSFAPFNAGVQQAAQQLQTQVPQAAQVAAQGIQQAPMAPAMQQQGNHLTQMMNVMAGEVQTGGQSVGASMAGGIIQGYTKQETVIDTIIRKHMVQIVDIPGEILQSHSPSLVFAAYGESMPMGLAVGYAGKAGVATNAVVGGMEATIGAAEAIAGGARVKELGETWATNMASGIPQVFKTLDLKQLSMPQIPSLLGKADLGQQGLLGPAGSGAFADKKFITNNGGNLPGSGGVGGGGSSTQNFQIQLHIGDEQVRIISQQVVNQGFSDLAHASSAQR